MGRKKRVNPHDLAKIGVERCNLNVFRIGRKGVMTFVPCCAILFGAVDGPGISGNSPLTQKQLEISDHNLACRRCSQTMPICTGSTT